MRDFDYVKSDVLNIVVKVEGFMTTMHCSVK